MPLRLTAALIFILTASTAAAAEDVQAYRLTIRDHRFQPETLEIPAGQKVRILISNEDATAEEFESYELNREKIIPGNSETMVFIGPLESGTYPFFGEFNPDTAKGQIVVK